MSREYKNEYLDWQSQYCEDLIEQFIEAHEQEFEEFCMQCYEEQKSEMVERLCGEDR